MEAANQRAVSEVRHWILIPGEDQDLMVTFWQGQRDGHSIDTH